MKAPSPSRSGLFDNIKCLLIFLVVFGHMLEPQTGGGVNFIYLNIYSFHMPAFIFVSGWFSRGQHPEKDRDQGAAALSGFSADLPAVCGAAGAVLLTLLDLMVSVCPVCLAAVFAAAAGTEGPCGLPLARGGGGLPAVRLHG